MEEKKIPGKNGEVYVPYEDRVSSESIVYFTRDLSKEGPEFYSCYATKTNYILR